MKINFHVFNIKYSDRCSEISVVGPDALRNWVEPKYIVAYGKHYAEVKNASTMPAALDVQLDFGFTQSAMLDNLDRIESKIKQWLKDKSGLDVVSFDYSILLITDVT